MTIPREFRFRSSQVSIRRNPDTGDIILSEVPNVDEVFAALDAAGFPEQFLSEADRDKRPLQNRPELDHLFNGFVEIREQK